MVRHIVSYDYGEGFTKEENIINAAKMKEELEALKGMIDGLVSIQLHTQPLEGAEADLLLDSIFIDEAALKAYMVHPEHVRVATNYVRPFIRNRKCLDFVM